MGLEFDIWPTDLVDRYVRVVEHLGALAGTEDAVAFLAASAREETALSALPESEVLRFVEHILTLADIQFPTRHAAPVIRRVLAPEPHADAPAGLAALTSDVTQTQHFDARFLKAQADQLATERRILVRQANRFKDEMAARPESDVGKRALEAGARQIIALIDAALARVASGEYGLSVVSGRPIPRERLEAIPWASTLVEEAVVKDDWARTPRNAH